MIDGQEERLLERLHASTKTVLADPIGQLPVRERLVFTLYWYEELTVEEIGVVLEESESQIRALYLSALTRIVNQPRMTPRSS